MLRLEEVDTVELRRHKHHIDSMQGWEWMVRQGWLALDSQL